MTEPLAESNGILLYDLACKTCGEPFAKASWRKPQCDACNPNGGVEPPWTPLRSRPAAPSTPHRCTAHAWGDRTVYESACPTLLALLSAHRHMPGFRAEWIDQVIKNSEDLRPGMILMGDWTVITPEEYERREAALTPKQRALRDLLVGHFGGIATALREAHEELADDA